MLVHSNASPTPTPGSISSTSNTLEPTNTSTISSQNIRHQLQQSSSSSFSTQEKQHKHDTSCTSATYLGTTSPATCILDSPTLARMECERIRLRASTQQQHLYDSWKSILNNSHGEDTLERNILNPNKQSDGRVSSMTGPIKRGLLWQQRDRIFSRWKERYFILTRDYLHCFKRASGSSNGRASDMGQFIFKVKLVDVDKVEWITRRSYSAIGLQPGREGKILLRCDIGLEVWFELLEECTLTSKKRRIALKIAQGPRSRASLAAPLSHDYLQSNQFGLCALDGTLMKNHDAFSGVRGQKLFAFGYGKTNPFHLSDSVPDLSALNTESQNHRSGLSTNHSTPQKKLHSDINNSSRYLDSHISQNNSHSNCNRLYDSPQRMLINSSFGLTNIVDEEIEDNEVELRCHRLFKHLSMENGNSLDPDSLYRMPKAPVDTRNSEPILPTHNNTPLIISDLDYSAHDSEMDTLFSIQRPSSYRDQRYNKIHIGVLPRTTEETSISLFNRTISNSPGGSFRTKQVSNQNISNLNLTNAQCGPRYSIQENFFKVRNEEEFSVSTKSTNRPNHTEVYDSNQNRCNTDGNQSTKLIMHQYPSQKTHYFHPNSHQMKTEFQAKIDRQDDRTLNNNTNHNNGNVHNTSVTLRDRYQHPALAAIMNEAQSIKCRDRSFSDCQQMPPRRIVNNNPSPSISRRHHVNPTFNKPTRV